MDWSKAKTILIISFLLLNIFLFLTIMLSDSEGVIQSDYIVYAEEYLRSKEITIDTKIPKNSPNTGKIIYTPREYDIDSIAKGVFDKEVSIPVGEDTFIIEMDRKSLELSDKELIIVDELSNAKYNFDSENKLEDLIFSYLISLGYKKSDLTGGLIKTFSTSKEYEYTVKYRDALLFDLIINAEINNEGILTLSVPVWDIKKGNEKNELLSMYQILVMANLPSGSVIENVVFGYKQLFEGDLYGNPIWQVTLDSGRIIYYNAYTGEEIDNGIIE